MFLTTAEAASVIKNGGIVAFPTETVYGLGALASNTEAVEKVFIAKNRPKDNPLICHFESIDQIKSYVAECNETAQIIMHAWMPGPCSLLLPLPKNSPLLPATLGQPSVICRIPLHPLAQELIKFVGAPTAAPSANRSGKMSGTNASMVENDFGNNIDGIIDGGQATVGIESTILDVSDKTHVRILRPGALGEIELQELFTEAKMLGKIDYPVRISNTSEHAKTIPGAKYRHYAPNTSIVPIQSVEEITTKDSFAIIGTHEQIIKLSSDLKKANLFDLGSHTNLPAIAQSLYRTFFELDMLQVSRAYFILENWGNSSLAHALSNRLQKVFSAQKT